MYNLHTYTYSIKSYPSYSKYTLTSHRLVLHGFAPIEFKHLQCPESHPIYLSHIYHKTVSINKDHGGERTDKITYKPHDWSSLEL